MRTPRRFCIQFGGYETLGVQYKLTNFCAYLASGSHFNATLEAFLASLFALTSAIQNPIDLD